MVYIFSVRVLPNRRPWKMDELWWHPHRLEMLHNPNVWLDSLSWTEKIAIMSMRILWRWYDIHFQKLIIEAIGQKLVRSTVKLGSTHAICKHFELGKKSLLPQWSMIQPLGNLSMHQICRMPRLISLIMLQEEHKVVLPLWELPQLPCSTILDIIHHHVK